jgi:hypothetical protein
MHDYHTQDFHFHADSPGEVLIAKMNDCNQKIFRTTAEEIVTFCAAYRLHALAPFLTLRTTVFQIANDTDVFLRTITPQTSEDALNMRMPIADLQAFAAQAIVNHDDGWFAHLYQQQKHLGG